ncbi:hypothetical protein TL13_1731 [Streptococcus suis TL13]|nr:hypothetical protein TL13_1731 [Streptococcus suis TL13]
MFSFVFEPNPSDRLATCNQEKARFVLFGPHLFYQGLSFLSTDLKTS